MCRSLPSQGSDGDSLFHAEQACSYSFLRAEQPRRQDSGAGTQRGRCSFLPLPVSSFHPFPPSDSCSNSNLARGAGGLVSFICSWEVFFLRVGDDKGDKNTLMVVASGPVEQRWRVGSILPSCLLVSACSGENAGLLLQREGWAPEETQHHAKLHLII